MGNSAPPSALRSPVSDSSTTAAETEYATVYGPDFDSRTQPRPRHHLRVHLSSAFDAIINDEGWIDAVRGQFPWPPTSATTSNACDDFQRVIRIEGCLGEARTLGLAAHYSPESARDVVRRAQANVWSAGVSTSGVQTTH